MDYNTSREKIKLSEYGRNVQNMIEHLMTIEDRDQRNQEAQVVFQVMHAMCEKTKNTQEFKDTVWEQLALISDYKLDIDYPCEIVKMTEAKKPNKPAYQNNIIRYKHYGKNIQNMLNSINSLEDESARKINLEQIGNHMKKLYVMWHNTGVEDETIIEAMKKLCSSDLEIPEGFCLISSREVTNPTTGGNPNKKKPLKPTKIARPARVSPTINSKLKRQRIKRPY